MFPAIITLKMSSPKSWLQNFGVCSMFMQEYLQNCETAISHFGQENCLITHEFRFEEAAKVLSIRVSISENSGFPCSFLEIPGSNLKC